MLKRKRGISIAGFTLMESMAALGVLSIGLFAVSQLSISMKKSTMDSSIKLDWNEQVSLITNYLSNQATCSWAITHGGLKGEPLQFSSTDVISWYQFAVADGAKPVAVALPPPPPPECKVKPNLPQCLIPPLPPNPVPTVTIQYMNYVMYPPNSPYDTFLLTNAPGFTDPDWPEMRLYPAMMSIRAEKSALAQNTSIGIGKMRDAQISFNLITTNDDPPNAKLVGCMGASKPNPDVAITICNALNAIDATLCPSLPASGSGGGRGT